MATWRSGYAEGCKTSYAGSIPAVASKNNIYFSVKKERKIHSFIFLAVFMSALFFISAPPLFSAETKKESKIVSPFDVLQVKIPGLDDLLKTDEAQVKCIGEGKDKICEYPWVGIYIKAIYKFLVGISGMLAVIVMMAGGYYWLFAGGNTGRVTQAKEYIGGAVMGLALALGSYMILNLINPDILQLKPIKISTIKEISVEVIKKEYESKSCNNLNGTLTKAMITGYCQPKLADFQTKENFLCRVGLNCACPKGKGSETECNRNNYCWTCCNDFDTSKPYCDKTASGTSPAPGQIAADLTCFSVGTKICIAGKDYTVTDTGKGIKGLHFDVWVDNCSQAGNITGELMIKIGGC